MDEKALHSEKKLLFLKKMLVDLTNCRSWAVSKYLSFKQIIY